MIAAGRSSRKAWSSGVRLQPAMTKEIGPCASSASASSGRCSQPWTGFPEGILDDLDLHFAHRVSGAAGPHGSWAPVARTSKVDEIGAGAAMCNCWLGCRPDSLSSRDKQAQAHMVRLTRAGCDRAVVAARYRWSMRRRAGSSISRGLPLRDHRGGSSGMDEPSGPAADRCERPVSVRRVLARAVGAHGGA